MAHGTKDGGLPDATVDATEEADAFDEEEDRPRFCSLSPFISRPAEVATQSEFYDTCRRGQLKQVIIMVEHGGIDLGQVDDHGKTAVHVCASHRHCHEVLGYLLEKGAGACDRDSVGETPLHAAASNRNVAGIQQLLQFGANVDVRDKNGCTPLFVGCHAVAHRAIVELLKGGSDPALVNGDDAQTALHALLHASQKGKNSSKKKPGHLPTPAALSLRETVDCLVKAGAPLMVADASGLTVFDMAAACDAELVHHMLLEYNLKPADALSLAIKHGDTIVAKGLLGGGKTDPCTIIDDIGSSLLHIAAAHDGLGCVKELLTGEWLQRAGAVPLNIDARDKTGRTALFVAALNGFVDIAAFLLDQGASPAIQTGSGEGVGYSFMDTVAVDRKIAMCELLARWEARGGEECDQTASSVSAKAPEGDVVFFSGAISFVHNSSTKHLWGPANQPPSPAEVAPRRVVSSTKVGVREHGINPWRGRRVGDGATIFESIGSGHDNNTAPSVEAVGGEFGVGWSAEVGNIGRKQPEKGAAKYVADDLNPRHRREKTLTSDEHESELPERGLRAASEPGSPPGKTSARKLGLFDAGKIRGRRARNNTPSARGDMPADRPRNRSTATDSMDDQDSTRPRAISSPGTESPRHQHRKLKPRAMNEQHCPAKVVLAAADAAGETTTPAAPTGTGAATPSAPATRKPSRALKTFW